MTIKKFMPGAATVNLAAGVTSGNIALEPNASAVRVMNTGAGLAHIHFGYDNTVVATTATSMPLAAGATEVFTKGAASYVAAITPSGSATLYFTAGEGI